MLQTTPQQVWLCCSSAVFSSLWGDFSAFLQRMHSQTYAHVLLQHTELQDVISPSISEEYHTQTLLQLAERCLHRWGKQRFTERDYSVDKPLSDPIKCRLDWKVITRDWSKSSRIGPFLSFYSCSDCKSVVCEERLLTRAANTDSKYFYYFGLMSCLVLKWP